MTKIKQIDIDFITEILKQSRRIPKFIDVTHDFAIYSYMLQIYDEIQGNISIYKFTDSYIDMYVTSINNILDLIEDELDFLYIDIEFKLKKVVNILDSILAFIDYCIDECLYEEYYEACYNLNSIKNKLIFGNE